MTDKVDHSSNISRRALLNRGLASAAMMAVPSALVPASGSRASVGPPVAMPKHKEMRLLSDRPLNMEAPAHLLDTAVTEADRLFVRNNGVMPVNPNSASWGLLIDGESVTSPVSFTLDQLRSEFEVISLQITLECGGNGRSEFDPPAPGNQWTTGAVGCPKWTGVRLRDVLEKVGIRDDAVYIGYYGSDTHLSGDPNKVPISRGVPIHKALEPETLLAFAMNDAPIPIEHGYPLRLVVGGWPGSVCGKWLERIQVRNKVHDGPKMTGNAYRVPCEPVARGSQVADDAMCIIESMPVKSLITTPRSGMLCSLGGTLQIGGFAWAGDEAVDSVDVSVDFGATWTRAALQQPVNRFAWQRFNYALPLKKTGYFEVWAKATDQSGRSQPMVVPGWNPKGYLNNACHRIAIQVV